MIDALLSELKEKAQELSSKHWGDDERHLIGKGIQCMYVQTENIIRERMKNNGWIPCSERLPEEPFGCLATVIDSCFNGSEFEDFENILPYHVGYDGKQWNNSDGEKIPFEVIAWQPLPEAYHEQMD